MECRSRTERFLMCFYVCFKANKCSGANASLRTSAHAWTAFLQWIMPSHSWQLKGKEMATGAFIKENFDQVWMECRIFFCRIRSRKVLEKTRRLNGYEYLRADSYFLKNKQRIWFEAYEKQTIVCQINVTFQGLWCSRLFSIAVEFSNLISQKVIRFLKQLW